MKNASILALSVLIMASCRSAPPAAPPGPPPVRAIGVVGGDALTDAIGVELVDQGFRTFQLPSTQQLTAAALAALAARGVDAVLVVTSAAGIDSLPDRASLRLVRTQNGETVATFDWANISLTAAGIPAEGTVRTTRTEAARELVRRLLETVPAPQ